ncbi:HlyD family secretion protein [Lysobacter capsici]|uniref:HlyD family secretion protein n=1 Tax=Lysobacter capsici TaxID=435897 RepID=UPI0007166068|nr:HlyD family secretion protein [Lysobacter capsici]
MNTAVNAAGGGAVDGEAKPRWRPSRKAVIAVAAAVALAIGGAAYILSPKRSVSTDNAYLQADSSIVAPKVRGLVAQVLVNHNQVVKRGDALLRIDAEEFDAKVASAGADLQDARAAVQAAQAALVSLDAEQRLAQSTVHAAQVSIRASDAQSEVAQANRRRYDNLVASGAVARQDVEQFRAAAITAQVGAQRSRAEFEVSRNQADVTRAKRSSLQAGLAQAQANVARAQAALNLALQDQRHTLIRAPIDGVVADRQIEQGDYVQPGTRVMSIVPLGALYVVANFKETQTARMMAGQRANIEVDALPGTTLHGRIDSFAPGSGSQFSLLPFEPGTGNFTKIVQRVPVRIRFDPGQPELARLRPGLSSTVSVRLDTPPTATLVSAVP